MTELIMEAEQRSARAFLKPARWMSQTNTHHIDEDARQGRERYRAFVQRGIRRLLLACS
jgi:hypothetical protein